MTDPKPPPPPYQPPQKVDIGYGYLFWILVFAVTIGVAVGELVAHYVEARLGF